MGIDWRGIDWRGIGGRLVEGDLVALFTFRLRALGERGEDGKYFLLVCGVVVVVVAGRA